MKKLAVLFSMAFLAFSLTACSGKDQDANKSAQTKVEHAKAPAGTVKEAPSASDSYDPTKDEDGDC